MAGDREEMERRFYDSEDKMQTLHYCINEGLGKAAAAFD